MNIVIFNTATDELLQTANSSRRDLLPEEIATKIFAARFLDPADYTVREITGSYTTNEFRKYCYIDAGVVYKKEYIYPVVDKDTISADGTDKATISDVPEEVEVLIDGVLQGTVGFDNLIEVVSSIPKEIKIMFSHEKYIPKEVIINAT